MVLEASAGDYHFVLVKRVDGTFECTRMPIDHSVGAEVLDDWAQLPDIVRVKFSRAQEIIAR